MADSTGHNDRRKGKGPSEREEETIPKDPSEYKNRGPDEDPVGSDSVS